MRLLLIAPVLMLAACAASEPAPAVVAAATPASGAEAAEWDCHKESSMGSNMIHTVCAKRQTQAQRDALQQSLQLNPAQNGFDHQAAGAAGH